MNKYLAAVIAFLLAIVAGVGLGKLAVMFVKP